MITVSFNFLDVSQLFNKLFPRSELFCGGYAGNLLFLMLRLLPPARAQAKVYLFQYNGSRMTGVVGFAAMHII
jgi:hypothetical protein